MSAVTEPVYDLNQLKHWPSCVPAWPVDGVALAVIGHPIAHSLSPAMHNAALAKLAETKPKFGKWRYFKFDIAPAELKDALDLFHKKGFRGLNLTVPHKTLALQYVDSEVATVVDAGAANTLKAEVKGWKGHNTDGYGLRHALKEQSVELTGANVILLGAGGAARGAAMECLTRQCASLRVQNRTRSTIETLISHLKKSAACTNATELIAFDPDDNALRANPIVINATSLGLKPKDESPLDLTTVSRPAYVFDMIYRPSQTALLRQATQLGIPNANGLSMLVHQGAASLALWTDEIPPVKAMQQALLAALN